MGFAFLGRVFSLCSFCIFLYIKIQRLPCLPSSMVALDTLMGTDESIGFEDFLNGMKHSLATLFLCTTCKDKLFNEDKNCQPS